MAAGRGGEAGAADVRARLGAAQADLAAEKVKAMRGETPPRRNLRAENLTTRRIRKREFKGAIDLGPKYLRSAAIAPSETV